jgi:hypothetical protein
MGKGIRQHTLHAILLFVANDKSRVKVKVPFSPIGLTQDYSLQ